jgi:hypothetical protein
MQRLEERDQSGGFRRTQILPVGRHVAATLNHLPNELIMRQEDRYAVESGATLPALVVKRVAVVALLHLEYESTLPLKRGSVAQVLRWNWHRAPGVHHWTPGRVSRKVREGSQRNRYQQNR